MHGSIAFYTVAVIELLLVAGAGVAAAQTPAGPASPTAGSTTAAAPATVPPVLRPYGIIRPAVVFGNGLESFGFNTFVAPTAAANPVFNAAPDDVGLSFQVTQTRFGVVIGERYPARATLEVDFVHFDQSSPITAAYPRVRQAFFEWLPREGHRLLVGQTWDLFAPLNTPSFDLVANMYLAGNAGFMRPQAMYVHTTDRFEYGAALGLQGPNNAATLTSVEYSIAPTVAGRAGIRAGKQGSLVASAIGTRIRLGERPAMRRWRWAHGGALSGERTLGPFNVRAEGYAGTNLGNLGLLTLTQGSVEASVSELGGWASLKYTPSPHHTTHLVAGGARLIDDDDLRLGYTPAVGATRAQRVSTNGPGISQNVITRLGYAFSPGWGVSFIVEPFAMWTEHKLAASDLTAGLEGARFGYGVEAGGTFQF
jgi:hypothetical protein